MFAAAQQMNNPDGLEFTGDAARAVAARVAAVNAEKAKKQAVDAEARRLAKTTVAGRGTGGRGRGGRGRGGRGGLVGRIPWKAVAAERDELHQSEVAALNARIRELEGGGGGGGAPAVAEGMAEGAGE
jgi:hypothetical protein